MKILWVFLFIVIMFVAAYNNNIYERLRCPPNRWVRQRTNHSWCAAATNPGQWG